MTLYSWYQNKDKKSSSNIVNIENDMWPVAKVKTPNVLQKQKIKRIKAIKQNLKQHLLG